MQLRWAAPLLLAVGLSAFAQEATPSKTVVPAPYPPGPQDHPDRISSKTAVFVQRDYGGNPDLDEDAFIVETLIVVKKQLGNHSVSAKFIGSVISSASYDAARHKALLVSAATTTIKNPGAGNFGLGWTYHSGNFGIGVRGIVGFEHAYRARGAGLDLSYALDDRNTTFTLMLQGYYDSVRMLRYDGRVSPERIRATGTAELGWTQVIDPVTIGSLTLHQSVQEGFLGTSYQSVKVAGGDVYEALPEERLRTAATLRVKRAINSEASLEGSYRYYRDSWGLEGHTLNFVFSTYLANRHVLFEPSYRFYHQNGARFFAQSFAAPQFYATSDSDLGPFNGHAVAVNFRFPSVRLIWLADYDLGLNYYYRTDGIEMIWLTVGFDLFY